MNAHDQFVDSLALYALDELTGDERQELETHLQACASCRREVQALRADLGVLGLSVTGPQPPARSKERLTRAIAAEPRFPKAGKAARRNPAWAWITVLASAALLLAAVILWRNNTELRDRLADLTAKNQQAAAQVDKLGQELQLLTSPDAVRVSLSPEKSPRQPSGSAIYSPSGKRVILVAGNLAPVPEGKAYELWLIPVSGAPIPSGVFKPDNRGNAFLDQEMAEAPQVKAFAITLEKQEGSDKPTSPILLIGAG